MRSDDAHVKVSSSIPAELDLPFDAVSGSDRKGGNGSGFAAEAARSNE